MATTDVMNMAFLGLGGNQGNRSRNIHKALTEIERLCGEIIRQSSIYETEPWGSPSGTKYLNMVIQLKSALSAREMLEKIMFIEKKLGRSRTDDQNADRIIDIDILFYDQLIIDIKHLHIPHPRLHLRKFVLVPLNEIAPELVHPELKRTIKSLLKNCPDPLKVKVFNAPPPIRYISIEGNIGSGKTTLAKALVKKKKAIYMAETYDQNNLLPLFYSNPQLYAFPLEYSFLIARYEQIADTFRHNEDLVISDYSIYKSLWFSKINLSKKEFTLFKKHFNALVQQIPKPDLIIYLKADRKHLRKNIDSRGRLYEGKIKNSYLKDLDKQYQKGIQAAAHHVLEIPIKAYHPELETELLNKIEKYLKENFG